MDERSLIRRLAEHFGPPPAPFVTEPFAQVLWEQVAYLATEARRREAFEALRTRVGLEPAAIAKARPATLTAIARVGGSIAPDVRAARMQRSAEMVLARWDGDLSRALELPVVQARAALAAFPMIGEPGADRILAVAGAARLVPLDSNALRVLVRLGRVSDAKDYRTTYRRARATVVPPPRAKAAWGVDAGALLRQLGQELCRRGAPWCGACPLRLQCPVGRGATA